ncbi:DUF7666 domain-containing protein [Cupriavidus taiwanensis]|uniref:DUF7666 domain-containing protein n=1 Tax=Cupriavidus taiwanensis TaxID=164546 RepID=UPI000E17F8DF
MSNSKPATSLVLRTCNADMSSQNGFVWPGVGEMAEAPDWINNDECGHGLHGWLYGQGDHSCSSYLDSTAKWLVVEVESDHIVMLGGKCKFPKAIVRFVGDKLTATQYLIENEPRAREVAVIGATLITGDKGVVTVGALGTATAGDEGTATAGNYGTATAGNYGTATAGDEGTATAGYKGTATAGYKGSATAGDEGSATAGNYGTATAGNYGTATAGYKGSATAGNYGTATAGDEGTATAGYKGTATAGYKGTATAGDGGEIRIRWYDHTASRYRTAIAYVGEDGIEANVAYRLDENQKFIRAE